MDSDTVRPGRRGRARCNRETSRSAGGLRLFSLKVVEKIRSRVRTTYNAVANELVSDQNMSGGNARDGKSIRRRCYDAINVLLACGLIKKDDKKQIVWRGHGSVEIDRLRAEVEKKAQEVEQKKKLLQDMERKHKTLQALLALGANREADAQDSGCGSGGSSSACSRSSQGSQRYTIPFMLVQAPARAQVQLHSSEDRTQIQFELTEAPPELHDDCSVVMRLQQHEAERQANQRSRKQRGIGPSQATDSGQPTPPPPDAATAAAAACRLGPCDFLAQEPLSQLAPPPLLLPLRLQEPRKQQLCTSQQLLTSRSQELPRFNPQLPQSFDQLQPAPQPQQQQQQRQQQPEQVPVALPNHLLDATTSLADQSMLDRDTPQPQPEVQRPQHSDFLANLKPVATSRSRAWHRTNVPTSVLHAHAPTQAISAQPAMHLDTATGASWQHPPAHVPAAAGPPQLPCLPRQTHPHPHPHPQAQVEFSQGGALSRFLCAHTQQPDCFHQLQHHRQHHSNSGPLQIPLELEEPIANDSHELQRQLTVSDQSPPSPALQPPLQHPPRLLQPTEPLLSVQHQSQLAPGEILVPSPPSLYAFEQMGDEHLPAALLAFAAEEPDPLGLSMGSATAAADQLGHIGWPHSMSPDPFSPSAFLVTPSFMQGQCRSEQQNRPVGTVQVGVQQQ